MLSKYFLLILAGLLALSNAFLISEYDLQMIRWGRLVTTSVIFISLIWRQRSDKLLLTAVLFLFLSDILLLNYEHVYSNAATFLSRISAYVLLVLVIFPEIRILKMSLVQKVVFALVFSLNIAMLYVLVDMVPEKYEYPFLNSLFYIYGSAMITLVLAAISYSNIYSDATALFFTAGALCLVFSDIMSFIAYYLEFHEFYYADRFFYIFGVSALVKFSTFSRNHEPLFEMERL
ncbi:lysoplasmalogenase family protein [Christiangramia portivictoriae]|uniref:lysoplasmalogenase family protein n=1 Tax=Christiangramia portivictoriae TaxID=326069 RepID=UPI00047ABF9F|nr:lysoplasmalogenase family protein [Christiangramia portivictoriae]